MFKSYCVEIEFLPNFILFQINFSEITRALIGILLFVFLKEENVEL